MLITESQSHQFVRFITRDSLARSLIFDFLEIQDIESLLMTQKHLYNELCTDPYINNKKSYQLFYSIDKTLYYTFFDYSLLRKFQQISLNRILSNSNDCFSNVTTSLRHLRKQLLNNLNSYVDRDIAHELVCDLFNCLRSPNLPLPKLRRNDVGIYCGSNIQLALVQKSTVQEEESETYFSLKRAIIQKQSQILTALNSLSKEQLIALRFKSETISKYQPTSSSLANIMLLIIQIVNTYLAGLKQIILLQNQQPTFATFVEFNVRYNAYKNIALELQSKFGFIFQHFNNSFNVIQSKYACQPNISLLRTMIKQWVYNMQDLNTFNNRCMGLITVMQKENKLEQMIENSKVQNSLMLNYMKIINYSNIYKQNNSIYQDSFLNFFSQNVDELAYIQIDYTEYLIDVSINEITANWCGHSQQVLSNTFRNAEKIILQATIDFLKYYVQGLREANLMGDLFFSEVEQNVGYKLKSVTVVKLLAEYQLVLNQFNLIKSQKHVKMSQQIVEKVRKIDEILENVNYEKHIPQSVEERFISFYAFDQKFDVQLLQQVLEQLNNDGFGSDEEELQGYISAEQEVDEQKYSGRSHSQHVKSHREAYSTEQDEEELAVELQNMKIEKQYICKKKIKIF